MSPITDDEQVDELKERRRARESRPGLKRGEPARIQFAEPARDLLGGLITSGSPEGGQDHPVEARDTTDASPEPVSEATTYTESPAEPAEGARQLGGEKIDELIRRVKEGTPEEADASTTIERRRPKGTADLPPTARPPRTKRIRPSTPSRRRVSRPRRTRLLGFAATLVVAGTAVLVLTLGGGSSQLRPVRSASSPEATTGSFAAFGGALSSAIAALGPGLSPFTRHAASATPTSRPRRAQARRRPARSHLKVARHSRRAAHETSRSLPASSASTTATTSQTQTQTYAPAPTLTTSQTPVSATHSTTSSNRSSGPTGSNPLGGIGSCVKGC